MKHFSNALKTKLPKLLLLFTLLCVLILGAACSKETDYTDYVSEYRSNLFLYTGEDFYVKVQDGEKEYPYVADGYKGEMTHRTEIMITAPEGTERCSVFFLVNGEEYGGEASFDTVKKQYYYSCGVSTAEETALRVRLLLDEEETELTAPSVRTEDVLSLPEIVAAVLASEKELISSLTDGKEFLGELYVRLLYEDAPYFYVGVVDRSGKITALLLDGESGKVLAKRSV